MFGQFLRGLFGSDGSASSADSISDSPLMSEINPATGLPMVHGIGGVDVAGNPYGVDLSSTPESDFDQGSNLSPPSDSGMDFIDNDIGSDFGTDFGSTDFGSTDFGSTDFSNSGSGSDW